MKIVKIVFLVLLISSCKAKLEEPTIDKQAFKAILADMHIAEEMVSKFKLADRDSVRDLYFTEIAEIHNIDTSEITRQIELLQSNPDYAFLLYQDVHKFLDTLALSKEGIADK